MKAFRGALTQSQAKDACRREGGSLAVLDSRTVNEGAKNLLKRGKPAKPHIIIIIIYVPYSPNKYDAHLGRHLCNPNRIID